MPPYNNLFQPSMPSAAGFSFLLALFNLPGPSSWLESSQPQSPIAWPNSWTRFIDKLHSSGVFVPIAAGIMPIFKTGIVKRMVELSSATIPRSLQIIIDKYGHSDSDMEKAGIDYSTSQIIDLLEQGVAGIHLYTMNRANLAREISFNANLRG